MLEASDQLVRIYPVFDLQLPRSAESSLDVCSGCVVCGHRCLRKVNDLACLMVRELTP